MAKATTKKAAKVKAADVPAGQNAPEAKETQSAKKAAAQKLFDNADTAAMAGLPPDITVEQRENQVRLGALGY
jgi:hypothetical protein